MTKYPSSTLARGHRSRTPTLVEVQQDVLVETRSGVSARIELSDLAVILGSLDLKQWLADRNERVSQRLREIWENES